MVPQEGDSLTKEGQEHEKSPFRGLPPADSPWLGRLGCRWKRRGTESELGLATPFETGLGRLSIDGANLVRLK